MMVINTFINEWVSRGLTSHSTHYRSFIGGWPNERRQSTEISFNPTRITPLRCNIDIIAGEEHVSICENRALCDNFLKLCMVLAMYITFSKTTAHKLGETPGGRYAKNPRWPPLETEKAISRLLLALQPCVIPVYLCFLVSEIRLWSHF